MKAIVIRQPGGPEVLRIEDVPVPAMRPDDVLIEVAACGVCFHDVVTRNGVLKRGIRMPLIPGHEVSGIVRSVGERVTGFRPGDRVATAPNRHICGHCRYCRTDRESACAERELLGDAGLNGGYAELVAVGADNVALVPDGISLEQAAIVGCAIGTELNAIRDVAHVMAGERVLVSGAGGGLGVHGVQVARLAGAEVIAVTTSPHKMNLLAELGAHHVVLAQPGEDFSAEVKRITGGDGVDVAIDNVGSVLFEPTRRSLAMSARWVFVGQLSGDFVKLSPAQVFLRNISIMGAKSASRRQLHDALHLVARGAIRPVIAEDLPLSRAAEAHATMQRSPPAGRIILRPGH